MKPRNSHTVCEGDTRLATIGPGLKLLAFGLNHVGVLGDDARKSSQNKLQCSLAKGHTRLVPQNASFVPTFRLPFIPLMPFPLMLVSVACLLCAKVGETIRKQAVALLRAVRLLAGPASRAGNRGLSTLDNVVCTSLLHARPDRACKNGENPRKGSKYVGCGCWGALRPKW